MQKILFPNTERGGGDFGWLKTKHSFSFGNWYNPEKMGFGKLRVINDDIVSPDNGFGMHPHSNMEIITIVTKGIIQHEDTMGNKAQIPSGDVQIMSAGSGLLHSESNPSSTENLELFQIWILPKEYNMPPRYDQKKYNMQNRINDFELIVSGNELDRGSLWINQDAAMSLGKFEANQLVNYHLKWNKNAVFVFVINGKVKIDEDILYDRDGIGISEIDRIDFEVLSSSEVLIIEVPKTI